MAALLSLPFSFHTSASADHLHHPPHLPTQHVPFKLFLSYSQAPEAALSRAKCLHQQGGFWGAVQAQSPFTLPGGREMPTLYQPYCEAHSQCYCTKGAKNQLSLYSQVFLHCSWSTRRFSAMGAHFFWERWQSFNNRRKTGGQQHDFPCLWALLLKDNTPDPEEQIVKGCIAQSALWFCSCDSVKDTKYLVLTSFLFFKRPLLISESQCLFKRQSNFLHTVMEKKYTKNVNFRVQTTEREINPFKKIHRKPSHYKSVSHFWSPAQME